MRKKGICFCCMGLITLLLFQTVSAKERLSKSLRTGEKREAENLIRAYYEAYSGEDQERIDELLEMGDRAWADLRGQWARDCGLKGYEVIRTEAQPMKEEGMWFVYAEYEVSVEGIEATIPGASCHVVRKTEGRWRDISDSDSPELRDEVQEIALDYTDEIEEVNRRYNDVLAENPQALEWLNHVAAVMQENLQKELWKEEEGRQQGDSEKGTPAEEQNDSQDKGTESGEQASVREESGDGEEKEGIYIVLPGDCLWHIAESRLGNGMKWTELYEWNRENIGDNPDLILIGTQLRLY